MHRALDRLDRVLALLEAFPETVNPGHFVIKLAAWCAGLLLLMQSVIELVRTFRPDGE